MKYKVLVTAPYFQLVVDQWRNKFAENDIEIVVPTVNERMEEEELLPLIGDVDGIICGDDRITPRVLDAAPKLKVISKWGTGIDSIDKVEANKRGIPVRNTLNAFTEPVSDTIFAFMLCFARGTIELDRNIRKGIWEKKLFTTLGEKTIGIIGVGNIGKAVIKRAEAFGMTILANDIEERPYQFMVPLEKLLQESDFVSLSTDLNPTSRQIINTERLKLMKPSAYLINAARGPLVDEKAVIKALQEKRIAGAAFDVYEEEPLPEGHPYRTMENVILSPHNANSSPKAWNRIHESTFNNLLEELKKHG